MCLALHSFYYIFNTLQKMRGSSSFEDLLLKGNSHPLRVALFLSSRNTEMDTGSVYRPIYYNVVCLISCVLTEK